METLRQKLRELSFMEMTPAAQAIVAELLALTGAQDSMPDAVIHHPTFDGLLKLAGPNAARELLAQLGSDLAMVEDALSDALTTQDTTVIRHQTHVLIALAGSVGAESLLQLAKALNQMAHLAHHKDMSVVGHRLLRSTTQVRAFVAERLAGLDAPGPFASGTTKAAART